MPKYVYSLRYTRAGLEATINEGFQNREAAVREMFATDGITFEVMYWTYGDEDVLVVSDVPDDAMAVGMALATMLGGAGEVSMTPLLTAAEMDQGVEAMPAHYRPPGAGGQ